MMNNQQTQNNGSKFENLNRYARNLVAAAQQGKLDPVIGRDD